MNIKKVLLAVSACLCAATVMAKAPEQINIVYVKAPFNLQNMVIKKQGLLEKAFAADKTQINWKTITSGAKQAQAMAAGAIDVSAVMNTASLLMANGAGNPIYVATGVSHPADTFAMVAKPGQKLSVKDLKGKKVAGPRGTVLHQLLVAALVKNGMKPTDVEFIPMDIPSAMSALTSGRVDAAMLAASAVIKAKKAGCEVITTAKGLVNVNLVMTASAKFAQEHPEALKKVVAVHRQANEWIRNNWDEAVAIGAQEHGISIEDAKQLVQWSNYYDTVTQVDVDSLKADQVFLMENGMMTKAVDVEKLVLPLAKE